MQKTNSDRLEDDLFTMDEVKTKTRQTAPEKHQICYVQVKGV